jgi:hypothetical protein
MANPNKVWGQSRIKANGRVYDTEGKSSLTIGGTTRSAQEADFRGGMFSEKTSDSKVECSILITGGISLVELQAIDDATITVEADTGQTYIVRHGYVAEEVTASEGKAKVTFQGPAAEEMTL